MHSGTGQIEGDRAEQPGSIRTVRLRLVLALIAVAFLPIAIAAPLAVTALDGQRAAQRLRIDQAASNVAADLAARLQRLGARAASAAAARAVVGAAGGHDATLDDAKAEITRLSDGADEGVRSAVLLDGRGRETIRAVGGRLTKPAATTVVDPLVGAALQAGKGEVSTGEVASAPDGTALVSMAVPVIGGRDAKVQAIVRLDLTLSRVVALASAQADGATTSMLLDAGGRVLADGGASPSGDPGPGGPTSTPTDSEVVAGAAAVPGADGWAVRVESPTRTGGAPLPLVAALGLVVTGIIVLVAWMARQVLRPAEELERFRAVPGGLAVPAPPDPLIDPVTGLGNHRAFQEELDRQLEACRRRQTSMAVVLIDLDDFQSINEASGHAAGDEGLAAFGAMLTAAIRPADRAFRHGGDEYALVLPGTVADLAVGMARRLLSSAVERRPGRGTDRVLPFSAGISVWPGLAADRRQLLTQADAALRWSKRHGRTMIDVFDPSRHGQLQVATSAADQSTAVADVVAQRLVRPVYQPIVELASGKVIGYEALVRPLPGSVFQDAGTLFEAAEAGGRTFELDAMCLAIVASGAASISSDLILTMNLSPRTLESEAFSAGSLVTLLQRTGLEPSRVVLELTEREQIEEMDRLRRNAAACRDAGFRLAADDVGAGNAGLRLLSQIQFDIVKIDLSLVQEGAIHEAALQVVGALQDLARRWGATVIAEGIETPEQLAVVRELEIGWGQGYLLGRPGSAEELGTEEMESVDIPAIIGEDDWLRRMARNGGGLMAPSAASLRRSAAG